MTRTKHGSNGSCGSAIAICGQAAILAARLLSLLIAPLPFAAPLFDEEAAVSRQ
jgi:hypothetical protein